MIQGKPNRRPRPIHPIVKGAPVHHPIIREHDRAMLEVLIRKFTAMYLEDSDQAICQAGVDLVALRRRAKTVDKPGSQHGIFEQLIDLFAAGEAKCRFVSLSPRGESYPLALPFRGLPNAKHRLIFSEPLANVRPTKFGHVRQCFAVQPAREWTVGIVAEAPLKTLWLRSNLPDHVSAFISMTAAQEGSGLQVVATFQGVGGRIGRSLASIAAIRMADVVLANHNP